MTVTLFGPADWCSRESNPTASLTKWRDHPLLRLYPQSGQVILLQGSIQHSDPLNLLSQNRLSSSGNLQMEQDLQGLCGWQRKILVSVSWDPRLHLRFTAAQWLVWNSTENTKQQWRDPVQFSGFGIRISLLFMSCGHSRLSYPQLTFQQKGRGWNWPTLPPT